MTVTAPIHPEDTLDRLYRMIEEEYVRYTDPVSGSLRDDLSTAVPMCPACGETERDYTFRKGPFDYCTCRSCGLVHLARRLNDAELHYLYNEGRCAYGFRNLYIATAEARVERIYRPKARLLSSLTDGRRLLDFGCSAGYFMRTARELGWDVHGVELNSFAVEWARETLGLNTVKDRVLADCGYKPGTFDIVTMWDVLEHLPEPLGALQDVRALIAPGGALVVETSHWDCLETRYLGADNTNIEGDAHLMHFTKRSLDRLLGKAGFRIERFDIFGLDLAHIIQFEKRKNLQRNAIDPVLLQALQSAVDDAGQGCYIRAIARPLT